MPPLRTKPARRRQGRDRFFGERAPHREDHRPCDEHVLLPGVWPAGRQDGRDTLAAEPEYLAGGWNLAKMLLGLLVPVSLIALALAL